MKKVSGGIGGASISASAKLYTRTTSMDGQTPSDGNSYGRTHRSDMLKV